MESLPSSRWHGLSDSANQPEALQALDLAQSAFAHGRYYQAERLCLRSLGLYDTAEARALLERIYTRIPHARPQQQQPHAAAAPPSSSSSSPPTSSSTSSPALPSWCQIPPKHRRPLLLIWTLVLLVALLRAFGFFALLDHSPYDARQRPTAASAAAGRGMRGSQVLSDREVTNSQWLLGLTNLLPLALMALFAAGQLQRRAPRVEQPPQ